MSITQEVIETHVSYTGPEPCVPTAPSVGPPEFTQLDRPRPHIKLEPEAPGLAVDAFADYNKLTAGIALLAIRDIATGNATTNPEIAEARTVVESVLTATTEGEPQAFSMQRKRPMPLGFGDKSEAAWGWIFDDPIHRSLSERHWRATDPAEKQKFRRQRNLRALAVVAEVSAGLRLPR